MIESWQPYYDSILVALVLLAFMWWVVRDSRKRGRK